MARRPDYSYKGGNYSKVNPLPAGVLPSGNSAADWNEIAKYSSALEQAVTSGGYITQEMISTGATPQATYTESGIVRIESPNAPVLIPRLRAINSGRKWYEGMAQPAATSITEVGWTANLSATIINNGTASNQSDANGACRQVATSNLANVNCGILGSALGGAGTGQTRLSPYMYAKFILRQASGYRGWFCAHGDSTFLTTDTPTTLSMYGVRFSPTSAGDTTFILVTSNGASATYTNTNVTVAADTLYEIETWADGSYVYCQINNGTVISTNLTLPTNSTSLTGDRNWMALRSITAGTEYQIKVYNWAYSQY